VQDPETLCFVCGPHALVEDVPRLLQQAGVAPDRIRTEDWGS
jgi:ferredoxin-NADP reductase